MRPLALRVLLAGVLCSGGGTAGAQQAAPMTREAFDALFARVDNAGRWGAKDALGTLNLVTPEVRRRATAGVRDGRSVSLSRELVAGPVPGAMEPASVALVAVSDTALGPADGTVWWLADRLTVFYHGWAFSHIDALSHINYHGRGYNGATATPEGAAHLDVRAMADGLVTRGVLLDLPLVRDVRAGPATAADLEAWERKTGVRIAGGDVVLIRGGRWAPGAPPEAAVGIHPATAAWLRERGVAAVGVEGSTDGPASLVPGITHPFHVLALVAMGMPQLENLDLDALAREAAARRRWSFLFVAAPIVVRGGTGAPINPLAVF